MSILSLSLNLNLLVGENSSPSVGAVRENLPCRVGRSQPGGAVAALAQCQLLRCPQYLLLSHNKHPAAACFSSKHCSKRNPREIRHEKSSLCVYRPCPQAREKATKAGSPRGRLEVAVEGIRVLSSCCSPRVPIPNRWK